MTSELRSAIAVEYRAVPKYHHYRVGSDGTVWSSVWPRCGWKKLHRYLDKDGYHYVVIYKDHTPKHFRVSRLVLEAFVGPCPKGMEACHVHDPTPENDSLDNLRWDTHANNIADKRHHGTHQVGNRSARRILNEKDVVAIRTRWAAGETQLSLAMEYCVCRSAISHVCTRRNWREFTTDAEKSYFLRQQEVANV
jgi:hypothetical protein